MIDILGILSYMPMDIHAVLAAANSRLQRATSAVSHSGGPGLVPKGHIILHMNELSHLCHIVIMCLNLSSHTIHSINLCRIIVIKYSRPEGRCTGSDIKEGSQE